MPNDSEDELVRLLGKAAAESEKIAAIGKDMVQFARLVSDVADPTRVFFSEIPSGVLPSSQLSAQVDSWRSWLATATEMSKSRTTVDSFGALCNSVTNTTVSGIVSVGMSFSPPGSAGAAVVHLPPAAQQARTKLFQTLERFPLVERARANMRRLGLDRRPGNKQTPLALLEHARAAVDVPSLPEEGPVGILISLRECIDACITELIRRRLTQEEAKGWRGKIASLGRHCARAGLAVDHFERVGVDTDTVMNALSGTKQAGMLRTQLVELFNRGLLSLNALLESIDEKQLRAA